MSQPLTHRQADTLPPRVQAQVERRRANAAGVHRDQDRRRGGKAARGGRQGERIAFRREAN